MTRMNREATVRRLLEQAPPPVPPGLHAEAARRGARLLRRRTLARRAMWLVLLAVTVVFVVWALTVRPWVEPPSETTPPLTVW
ncbi:hypothetical protein [Streptomyces capillispiralis]|uniref:Uncharacterized protein n=1 Tax=Streptomyces capillispiralis TaxID=68182 RepID=A0A561TEM9_9ACTN|nr:hypothetical protein [Streptomyces capillispiralis]TWF85566.1 hypothetical protein FHX78_112518 [Streptomyces capillispiralis]GHH90020.1 hypothetical protein GCM10017779_04770 [Streptomyces capillispiralis]